MLWTLTLIAGICWWSYCMSYTKSLFHFRVAGEREFLQCASAVILKRPSVQSPNGRKRLQTFSERKINKTRVKQLQKDEDLILTARKKKISYSIKTGTPIESPNSLNTPLPSQIMLGVRWKGYTTHSLQSHYKVALSTGGSNRLPLEARVCCNGGHVFNQYHSHGRSRHSGRLCKILSALIYNSVQQGE